MKVAIRADAALHIGTGHVMRCLTLAHMLCAQGANVLFICREHDGHLCKLIEQCGFRVSRLLPSCTSVQFEDAPAHAAWLGASWQEDAEQTRSAIETLAAKPDWLVVDHYAIDSRWERCLRNSVGRIMAIDDLADRAHDCDLLLDQNLVAQLHSRYYNKVPDSCGLLLGPEYALLQKGYAELHNRIPPREGQIRRVLIFFGGADASNLTGRAIAAFLQTKRTDVDVDVVVGASCRHVEDIRRQVAGHENIHLHSGLPTLAPLMVKADLAIGAGGATTWERLCTGLPALVVTLAENQRPIAEELNQRGLICWLGHSDMVNEASLAMELEKLFQRGLEEKWSLRCLEAVDGLGANRVCAALTATENTPLSVRHATLADENLLLAWANDPVTRRNAFSSEPIAAATHRIWFRNRLRNLDDCHLYIIETSTGVALGQVRFERQDHEWEIDYALSSAFRGRGLGRHMLEAAMQSLRSGNPEAIVIGRVKYGNQPSQKVFESLGFDRQLQESVEVIEYRHIPPLLGR